MSEQVSATDSERIISLQASSEFFAFLVYPPVIEDEKVEMLTAPEPGITARAIRILRSGNQLFLFDRSSFGLTERPEVLSKNRTMCFKKTGEEVAESISNTTVNPQIKKLALEVLPVVDEVQRQEMPTLLELEHPERIDS